VTVNGGKYDCQQCGACCVDLTGKGAYVLLTSDEADRLDRLGLPVVSVGKESFLGTRLQDKGDRVCIALAGAIAGQCACSIYPDRPAKCCNFEVGGWTCQRARRAEGLFV
jgi:Fe-S-cluster containining protein